MVAVAGRQRWVKTLTEATRTTINAQQQEQLASVQGTTTTYLEHLGEGCGAFIANAVVSKVQ